MLLLPTATDDAPSASGARPRRKGATRVPEARFTSTVSLRACVQGGYGVAEMFYPAHYSRSRVGNVVDVPPLSTTVPPSVALRRMRSQIPAGGNERLLEAGPLLHS